MTIPIFLTSVRLVGVFVLAPLLVHLLPAATVSVQWLLTVIFILIALTDACDGFIARACQQVSHLGCVLDPIADKFLMSGCLLALLAIGRMPFWVVFLLLMRELAVMSLRLLAAEQQTDIVVSATARVKTWAQVVTIAWCISPLGACTQIFCRLTINGLFVVGVVLSWHSAAGYARVCWRVLKRSL